MFVLLSNSIPKSGSTLLYESQRVLAEKCYGGTISLREASESSSVFHHDRDDNFFIPLHDPDFIEFLSNYSIGELPLIIKTHDVLNPQILELILKRDDFFMSFAVRDPADIFFSARDNFSKSGEFEEFQHVERGLNVLNGFFREIYDSVDKPLTQRSEAKGKLSFVRYEQIVTDVIGATIDSLPPQLREAFFQTFFRKMLSVDELNDNASYRLNIGSTKPRGAEKSPELRSYIEYTLSDFRRDLGYAED